MKSTGYIYQKEVHDDHTVYRNFLDDARIYVVEEGIVYFEHGVEDPRYDTLVAVTHGTIGEVVGEMRPHFDALMVGIYNAEGLTPVTTLAQSGVKGTVMVMLSRMEWTAVCELRRSVVRVQEHILKYEDRLLDAQTVANMLDYYAERGMTATQMTESQFLCHLTADFFEAPF